jgi:hypothetical protein
MRALKSAASRPIGGMLSNEAPALHEALAVYDKAEHIDGSEAL